MTEEEMKAMEQETPKKSNRDVFWAGFAERHPDTDMQDREARYAVLQQEYADRDEELSRYRDSNNKLNEMFKENPESAYFLNSMADPNEKMGVTLLRYFGPLFKAAIEDPTPENQEAFTNALEEHAERLKEDERLQEEFDNNITESEAVISEWADRKGLNEDELNGVRDCITKMFTDYLQGKVTTDILDAAYKSINYENDVNKARKEGEVQGRNEQITEKLRKTEGDGIPAIVGGGRANTKPKDDFLKAASRPDPWASAKYEKY